LQDAVSADEGVKQSSAKVRDKYERSSGGRSLWDVRAKRGSLSLRSSPHPGYVSTAVQRVKLTFETCVRNTMRSLNVNGLSVEMNATPDTPSSEENPELLLRNRRQAQSSTIAKEISCN
jgi:hypothetical protein